MRKFLPRSFAILLILCVIVDPSLAATCLVQEAPNLEIGVVRIFHEEALAAADIESRGTYVPAIRIDELKSEAAAREAISSVEERGENLEGMLLGQGDLPKDYGLKAWMIAKVMTDPALKQTILASAAVRLKDPEKGFSPQDERFLKEIVKSLEGHTNLEFGGGSNLPLLLAVRSSPVRSKPGAFSTAHYIGFTKDSLRYYVSTGQSEFGFETYVYFIRSYIKVVLGKEESDCPEIFGSRLTADNWEAHATKLSKLLEKKYRLVIPEDPYEQLTAAIAAVQNKMHRSGMAGGVWLQEMGYPHRDGESGSGVALTVDLKTGEDRLSARFGIKTQGPDIVTGNQGISLSEESPFMLPLRTVCNTLERLFKKVLYLEFLFEHGVLRLLQVRVMDHLGVSYHLALWKRMLKDKHISMAEIMQSMMDVLMAEGIQRNKITSIEGILLAYSRGMSLPGDQPIILCTASLREEDVLQWISEGRLAGVVTPDGHPFHHAIMAALATHTPIVFGFTGNPKPLFGKAIEMDTVKGTLTPIIKFTSKREQKEKRPTDRQSEYLSIKNTISLETEMLDLRELATLHSEYSNTAMKYLTRVIKNKRPDDNGQWLSYMEEFNLKAHFVHEIIKERESGVCEIVLYSRDFIDLRSKGDPKNIFLRQVEKIDEFQQLRKRYGLALRLRVVAHEQLYGRRALEMDQMRTYTFYRVQAYIKQKGTILFSRRFVINLGSGDCVITPLFYKI